MPRVLPGAHAGATRPVSQPPSPLRFLSAIPRKILQLLGVLIALFVAYTVFGFVIAPRLVRRAAVTFVREEYGRVLTLGDVRVHPFKLYVDIRDVSLPDSDSRQLLGFDRLFVDFELWASIWERSYVFRDISLERPKVRAVIRPDGSFNLADLAPKQPAKADERADIPRVWVQGFEVARAEIELSDLARSRPFNRVVRPLSFVLRDFRTEPQGGGFRLNATGEGGAELSWNGKIAVVPELSSSGALSLRAAPLTTLAEYLADELPFAVLQGKLRFATSYRARMGKHVAAQITIPELVIEQAVIHARGDQDTAMRVAEFVVSDTTVSLPSHSVRVGRVAVRNLETAIDIEPDGTVNLKRLISREQLKRGLSRAQARKNAPPSASDSADVASDVEPQQGGLSGAGSADTDQLASEPDWAVTIAALELAGARVEVQDRALALGTKVMIAPLDLTARDLTRRLDEPVPVTANATIDEATTVKVTGTFAPQPVRAELAVDVKNGRMASTQPYVERYADLTIQDGALDATLGVTLAPGQADAEKVTIAGDVTLNNLRTIDNTLRQDFVSARGLELKGMRYTSEPPAFTAKAANLRGGYAHVVLSKQQVLNISAAFTREPPARPQRLSGARPKPELASELTAETSKKVKAGDSEADMPVRIASVRMEDTQVDFADYFVRPNFSARLYSLHGTLKGVSNDPRANATIQLKGKMGENALVYLSGTLQPFAYDKRSDLTLATQNVELAVFNPYSGRYAGYNIARGELSSEFHYVLLNRELKAEHEIRIDQLKWGEKTESKDEAPLPVKLATVLLRDRHGVITLDLPVKGTLDDPTFRIGPIIWQVFKNIIVKSVTVPFTALGKVFKGVEDAQYVWFAPGEAGLDGRARRGLEALTEAMVERAELKLDVPVGALAELDLAAMRERKWRMRATANMRGALLPRELGAVQAFDELDDERKLKVLSSLHKELTGKEPQLPAAPQPQGEQSRREAHASETAFQVSYLERVTREQIKVDATELDALGQQRGEAIERALIATGKVDHTRVLLSEKAKVEKDQGKVRYELAFE